MGTFVLIFVVCLALYFLPVAIARRRDLSGVGLLFIVNLLLGWTAIGWLVCLLWAALGQTKAQRAYYERASIQ